MNYINNVKYTIYSECWRRRRHMGLLNKKNHISPGQDSVSIGKDKGMKMKMLEDQAEYYDYLDDEEVWVQLHRFDMVLFWHQFL